MWSKIKKSPYTFFYNWSLFLPISMMHKSITCYSPNLFAFKTCILQSPPPLSSSLCSSLSSALMDQQWLIHKTLIKPPSNFLLLYPNGLKVPLSLCVCCMYLYVVIFYFFLQNDKHSHILITRSHIIYNLEMTIFNR